MQTVIVSPALVAALDAVQQAELSYVEGRDSSSVVEVPKIALANAVLEAVRLAKLPQRAGLAVTTRPALRRRRA